MEQGTTRGIAWFGAIVVALMAMIGCFYYGKVEGGEEVEKKTEIERLNDEIVELKAKAIESEEVNKEFRAKAGYTFDWLQGLMKQQNKTQQKKVGPPATPVKTIPSAKEPSK